MITRQELGQGVWYDPNGTGYIMLDVTDSIPEQKVRTIAGVNLLPKEEYHCSLVAARKIAESIEQETKIVDIVRNFLAREAIHFLGLTDERYICRKNEEMTMIAGARVDGLDRLRAEIITLFPHYEPPFAHVTLLKSENSAYGIGINSNIDLVERCIRL